MTREEIEAELLAAPQYGQRAVEWIERLQREKESLRIQLDATRDALEFAALVVEYDEEGMPVVTRTGHAAVTEQRIEQLQRENERLRGLACSCDASLPGWTCEAHMKRGALRND